MKYEYKKLEKKLKSRYPKSNFYIKKNYEEIEILYDNKKYINDSDFLDDVFDIASGLLTEEELWKLVISYDLFKEIPEFELEFCENPTEELKFHCAKIEYGIPKNQYSSNIFLEDKITIKGQKEAKVKALIEKRDSIIYKTIIGISNMIFKDKSDSFNTLNINMFKTSKVKI